jgi:NitT/TauT family transport system substrate-binding protein
MNLRKHRGTVAVAVALALLLAACGGESDTGGSGSGGDGASESGEAEGTKEFSVGFTSLGLSSAPFLAALDTLRDDGYSIETPELAESELVTEGVANGDFAFGSGANNAVMLANTQGANLRLIVDRVQNEWTLYARNDITECADLDGKRVAIHSEGAVSTVMVRNYIAQNCPDAEPEYIIISGSPNRLAALLADQIDASPLEVTDTITIDNEASDRFGLLASFSEELPELSTTSVYVNGDFADENPGTVEAVVQAVLEQHRQIEGDPDYLKQIAEEYVGDALDPETVDAVAQRYVDLGLFDPDGGLTEEKLTYTAEFFGPDNANAVEELLPVEDFADLTYLEQALNELGSS